MHSLKPMYCKMPGRYIVHQIIIYIIDCQNRTIIGKPGERGEVKSPMYPKKYENNLNCSWTIIFPYGYNIELRFLDIDIEAHSEANCPYDKLEVVFIN